MFAPISVDEARDCISTFDAAIAAWEEARGEAADDIVIGLLEARMRLLIGGLAGGPPEFRALYEQLLDKKIEEHVEALSSCPDMVLKNFSALAAAAGHPEPQFLDRIDREINRQEAEAAWSRWPDGGLWRGEPQPAS